MKETIARLTNLAWDRFSGLISNELKRGELPWLVLPHNHLALLTRRRATMLVNRVRLFALLFAVLTPLWSIVDFVVFPFPLSLILAVMRLLACSAFVALLVYYRPSGNLFDAYRAMALLFAIPTIFYITSHLLLGSYQLAGLSAAFGAGYAFLPFVLLAGLSIFPLTLIENLLFASPMLATQAIAGILSWESVNWPSYAGAFWLLTLITAVSTLAGTSQLAFMIALVRQAIRDPLTGVFSRNSGEEMLELQVGIARRSGTPISVAFIDLDHFKQINDRFGHEAGDKVLISTTARVGSTLRRGDVLIRWGGEEFLLVMPNTTLEQAENAMARIRAGGLGDRPEGQPVTASIGIAEYTADAAGSDWKTLVEKADLRMYGAKQAGRDRVVSRDE